jgi:hypothetical protein
MNLTCLVVSCLALSGFVLSIMSCLAFCLLSCLVWGRSALSFVVLSCFVLSAGLLSPPRTDTAPTVLELELMLMHLVVTTINASCYYSLYLFV